MIVLLRTSKCILGMTTSTGTNGGLGRECPTYIMHELEDGVNIKIIGAVRIKLHRGIWAPEMLHRKRLQDEFGEHMENLKSASINKLSFLSDVLLPKDKTFAQETTDSESTKTPVSATTNLRVALWNIQFFHDFRGHRNIDKTFDEIKTIDADVIVLNEVMFLWPYLTKEKFVERMKSLGYEHFLFGDTTDWCWYEKLLRAFFGNVICSKREFSLDNVNSHLMRGYEGRPWENRCIVSAELNFDKSNKNCTKLAGTFDSLRIVGTHLEIWDPTGRAAKRQVDELLDREKSNQNISNKSKRQLSLLCGDLNSFSKKDFKPALLNTERRGSTDSGAVSTVSGESGTDSSDSQSVRNKKNSGSSPRKNIVEKDLKPARTKSSSISSSSGVKISSKDPDYLSERILRFPDPLGFDVIDTIEQAGYTDAFELAGKSTNLDRKSKTSDNETATYEKFDNGSNSSNSKNRTGGLDHSMTAWSTARVDWLFLQENNENNNTSSWHDKIRPWLYPTTVSDHAALVLDFLEK